MRRKKRNSITFQNKLVFSNLLLIIFIIVVNVMAVFVYNTMNYNEYLSVQQHNTVAQIGNSYETIIGYVQSTMLKKAYQNKDMDKIVNNYTPSVADNMAVIKKLEEIIAHEEFISSVHLYLENDNVVLSSSFNKNSIDSSDMLVEMFGENRYKRILDLATNISSPQIIKHNGDKTMAMTMTMEIETQSGKNAYLIVNIDVEKLGKQIINKNTFQGNNMRLEISNDNGDVFYTYSKAKSDKNFVVAEYYSQRLDWKFSYSLDNEVLYKKLKNTFLYFMLVSIAFMIVCILISVKNTRKTTNPVNKILENYYNDFWIAVLSNDIPIDSDVLEEMYSKSFDLSNENYIVAVSTGAPLDMQSRDDVKTICIGKEEYAMIIKQRGRIDKKRYFNNADSFIGISSTKNSIVYMHNAYLEAKTCLNYKICMQEKIIEYDDIKHFKNSYEYDYGIERKILNSVNIADYETAEEQVFKFFDGIKNMQLEDAKIMNAVYRLQNAILRNIQAMQIVVYADDFSEYKNSLSDIRKKICDMIKNLCEIIKSDVIDTNKQAKNDAVMDLIDSSYTNPGFCIDYIADTLKINKNEIAKIVKLNTAFSFPEYVNRKKIEYAKKLLVSSDDTIEMIAKKIGYSYSYYFIKVFRDIEGITPKQYRTQEFCDLSSDTDDKSDV